MEDLGREDIDPREFHAEWDGRMFPFHRHVRRAHRFLPISCIMTGSLRLVLKERKIFVERDRLEKYIALTRSSFINYGKPFDDARPTLELLKQRSSHLGVISNADMDLYKQLVRMKLLPFFKSNITSYEARSYKPCRTIFQTALRLARCTADNAAMVGDSIENDILGASKVGMTTVLVNRGVVRKSRKIDPSQSIRPDFVVSNLREISTKLDI